MGRHLVASAVASGHEVTVLHRGIDCSSAPHAEHLHADRDGDLSALAGRRWEATVDVCAYWPRQVESLADALGDRGGRYALISSVSVYAGPAEPGLDERAVLRHPLGLDGDAPAISADTYGRLKVGCEQVAQRRNSGEALIVRPTFIIGPNDPTGRFPYWVSRMERGGEVLCPGSPDAPFQWIDVRDLAAFVVGLLEAGDDGVFHAIGPEPPFSFGDMLAEVRDQLAPEGTRLVWVPNEWLAEHGVAPEELPLWVPSDDPDFTLALDPDRAREAGLLSRPLAESIVDTHEWMADPAARFAGRGVGASAQREAALLAAWAGR